MKHKKQKPETRTGRSGARGRGDEEEHGVRRHEGGCAPSCICYRQLWCMELGVWSWVGEGGWSWVGGWSQPHQANHPPMCTLSLEEGVLVTD